MFNNKYFQQLFKVIRLLYTSTLFAIQLRKLLQKLLNESPRVILTQIASIFIFFLSLVRDISSSIKDRRLTKEKVSDSKGQWTLVQLTRWCPRLSKDVEQNSIDPNLANPCTQGWRGQGGGEVAPSSERGADEREMVSRKTLFDLPQWVIRHQLVSLVSWATLCRTRPSLLLFPSGFIESCVKQWSAVPVDATWYKGRGKETNETVVEEERNARFYAEGGTAFLNAIPSKRSFCW